MEAHNADSFSEWALRQYQDKYAWKDDRGKPVETWPDTAKRVVGPVLGSLGYGPADPDFQDLVKLISERKFIPGGRYLANVGRPYHQVNNCFLYRCEDSREGWADVVRKSILALSSGGGIGIVYSDVREEGAIIRKTGGYATGPLSPAQMVNECARQTMAGGFRRSAIWGGLHWWHPDIFKWITIKDWSDEIKAAKEADYNAPAPLDMTNISVILDDEFFEAYHDKTNPRHGHAWEVYWKTVEHMLRHGEPGFSINTGDDADECLRNACTEVCSADDSDVCNLGSINMARITSKDEMKEVVRLGTLFLLCGSVYSDVPHEEVRAVREKNRRLGLGLMGVHEWLLAHGHGYEITSDFREYLDIYTESTAHANRYADLHVLSRPVKTRAIAPNGTIGILAETTTSAEPVLYVAYKRYFLDEGKQRRFQYVLDPTVIRMAERLGIDPASIETAHSLAHTPERRIKFLADLQEYVDHGISSTINLPQPITDRDWVQHYGETFLPYLPKLRGFTCYPNGARAGQPFDEVPYEEAKDQLGQTFDVVRDGQCVGSACGV